LRIPQGRLSAAPHLRNWNGSSGNWSGYASATSLAAPQTASVTDVRGRWTVPSVKASRNDAYSSFWIGIDGYTDNSVEQIGTEQDWTGGAPDNYAWFEMYPKAAFLIDRFPIGPGDRVGARVEYIGNATFLLSITNFTRGHAYTVPTRYTHARGAQYSSAEWVVEAPYSSGFLPLANFGIGYFHHCVATINGTTGPINDRFWRHEALSMETSGGTLKARPSGLTDTAANGLTSSAFWVKWYHE
jgi:hypothetical protein